VAARVKSIQGSRSTGLTPFSLRLEREFGRVVGAQLVP
jgi:hypothetical protein